MNWDHRDPSPMDSEARQAQPPPLPPSPLSEVREIIPFERLPLPWVTVIFAFLTGPGAALLPTLLFVSIDPDAHLVGLTACGIVGARGLLLASGAALSDRTAPSWPRVVRWGVGMALAAVVLSWRGVVGLLAGTGWPPLAVRVAWLTAPAIRDGLVGVVSGHFLSRDGGVLWRAAIGAAVIWTAYIASDLAVSGPLSGPAWLPGAQAPQELLTWLLGGSLLPVALAFGLRLAWGRALEAGAEEGQ